MYEDSRLAEVDEIAMPGLYYENHLKIDAAFDNCNRGTLNGYNDDLDDFFEGKIFIRTHDQVIKSLNV